MRPLIGAVAIVLIIITLFIMYVAAVEDYLSFRYSSYEQMRTSLGIWLVISTLLALAVLVG